MTGSARNGVQRLLPPDLVVDLDRGTARRLPLQRLQGPGEPQDLSDDDSVATAAALLRGQAVAIAALAETVGHLQEQVRGLRRAQEQDDLRPAEDEYEEQIARVRILAGWLPQHSVVAVLSRGDERLLQLGGRRARHFPCLPDGSWIGHHPASSGVAIVQLECQRAAGATHLLLPALDSWWLEHYADFASHLEGRYTRVFADPETGVVFELTPRPGEEGPPRSLSQVLQALSAACGDEAAVLDLTDGALDPVPAAAVVFAPPAVDPLPYLDGSVDVVVVSEPEQVAEASRVARCAVVQVDEGERVLRFTPSGEIAESLPSVSIVVPTYDAAGHVRTCLKALQETLPVQADVEILVVDDGGHDETPLVVEHARARDPRIRLLRSRRNGGFIDACHRGADEAAGDVLLFLNNDTIPLPGWLEPIRRRLRDDPSVGAVGGKLVFPDGTLQEAGGVLYSDGSGANFGKWDPAPEDPLYMTAREVDYCSGALLATPTWLWRELGGFDRRYSPAYYEDTDYCLSVWEAGLRVLYQPDSVVVHLEGATAGRDGSTGMKRYQALNRDKFADRWQQVLARRLPPPQAYDRRTWHQVALREPAPVQLSRGVAR